MTALNAIPGYNELKSRLDTARQQALQYQAQRNAATSAGNTQAAQQYQEQFDQAVLQVGELDAQLVELITESRNTELASPTVTTSQSQSTPTPNTRTGELAQPTQQGGTGAGTSRDAARTINSDNNARSTAARTQGAVNVSTANLNQLIPTQPNQLDQYASYTYGLSWYVLSREQYNDMMVSQKPTISGWKLLMQSGGAPQEGRAQAFSLDYYMDDLEITTLVPGGGTRMAHSATDLKFKVVEPNGITLIENLFKAVQSMYQNSKQSQTSTSNNGAPTATSASEDVTLNYLTAHYCMVIRFYGYDKDGNLVAPIRGAFNTDVASGGYGRNAVIAKYFPFTLTDIKFAIANRAIEYAITAKCTGQYYAYHTDRGTVPYPFTMTGQTVEQLLNGPQVVGVTGQGTNTADPGARKDTPSPTQSVNDIRTSAGVNADGNFTGETQSPFQVGA